MKTLLAFGEALIDLLQDRQAPSLYHRNAGGAPANVAVGFARLGGQAAFMGMLANDDFGHFLHAELGRYKVDTASVRRTGAANTALAVVSLDAAGERSFGFYRPPAADILFSPGDIDGAAFAARPYLHLCSNSLTDEPARSATLAVLALAERHRCLVSFDVNWRASLWPAGADAAALIRPLLPRAHVLKFSAQEWQWLCEGDEARLAQTCFGGATELLVVTDGAAPVRTLTRAGDWTAHAVAPVEVVDSTAAGDAFVAGLLHALARADLEAEQLRGALAEAPWLARQIGFASRCGALACGSYGAFAALPTLEACGGK